MRQLRASLVLLLLAGCKGCGPADGDTGGDTAEPLPPSLAEAPVRIHGDAGDLAGTALADAGDSDGDGVDEVAVAGLGGRVTCVFGGPVTGAPGLHDARTCLTPAADYDFAGQALAGADTDGDGLAELLVGAPGTAGVGANAGAVWRLAGPLPEGEVSVGTGVAWAGLAAGDALGSAVALPGDVDGDGLVDALLGAPGDDVGGPEAGAVYLVRAAAPGPLEDATVFRGGGPADGVAKHQSQVTGDGVGAGLCAGGDIDGDGLVDVVIPAPGSDRGAENGGAVAIFAGPVGAGTWTLDDADTLLVATRAGGYAGGAVDCGGDTDGDGHGELLIGADADGGGRVYLWRAGALDDAAAVISADNPTDQAGYSVAFVAGVGFAVGVPAADDGATDAGRVAVFTTAPAGAVSVSDAELAWRGEADGDLAGTAIAGLVDLDGAGTPGLAVGAPYNRDPAPVGGAAYLLAFP